MSLLQGHASPPHPCWLSPVSYQILWVSFLITGFASHLPVCCSLCQEQSNRPCAQPIPAQQSPTSV